MVHPAWCREESAGFEQQQGVGGAEGLKLSVDSASVALFECRSLERLLSCQHVVFQGGERRMPSSSNRPSCQRALGSSKPWRSHQRALGAEREACHPAADAWAMCCIHPWHSWAVVVQAEWTRCSPLPRSGRG